MTLPLLSFHEEYTDLPEWVLLAIGAGIFLLILLAIILSVRARRQRRAAPEPAYAWNESAGAPPPDPFAPPQDTAAFPEPAVEAAPAMEPEYAPPVPEAPAAPASGEVHYCRCPSCQTQFSVNGPKPIVTNCPGCGKKGYLR